MAKILVVGLGYVGLMSAIGFAKLGHSVTGIDIDKDRVLGLRAGVLPFHEPGLNALLEELTKSNSISWVDDYDKLDPNSFHFAFICVSTPSGSDGTADISRVEESIKRLEALLGSGSIIVIRSTVPIGSTVSHYERLEKIGIGLAYNPEFLSEGSAVAGFFEPDRIVVGSENPVTAAKVVELYEGVDAPSVISDLTSAETVKHASNSFLALRLSFVNELAMLCKASGAKFQSVSKGMGLDPRIGMSFLEPGPGWGGSCFPKDTLELVATSQRLGARMGTVEAAVESNNRHIAKTVEVICSALGGAVDGKTIAVWGLSFKAGTDDVRDSSAVAVAQALVGKGANLKGYDPSAKAPVGLKISQESSAMQACANSDALVVLTEWPEFKQVEPEEIRRVMLEDAAILDFRNVLEETSWRVNFKNLWKIGS
jgi:UDPglucose 6-dehydrogenase